MHRHDFGCFVSGINTSSPMSHKGEEANFHQWNTYHQRLPCRSKSPSKLPSELYFLQWITTHQGFPYKSKSPRRISRGSPNTLINKSSFLVDLSPRTSSWVRTTRPLVHISSKNWICRHKPHTSQNRRIHNLGTYPPGIEYTDTDPILVRRTCAYILRELNMQAKTLCNLEFMHISWGNWICRHNRRGRDRDQGYPEEKASPEKVEIEMEAEYYLEVQATQRSLRQESQIDTTKMYPFKLVWAPCLFGWWMRSLAIFVFHFSDFRIVSHLPFACNWKNKFCDSELVVAHFPSNKCGNSNIRIPCNSIELKPTPCMCVMYHVRGSGPSHT